MKSITAKSNRKAAFTIVELLTVMSIIVILIGLLVPALNQVRKFAREVRQQAQFNSINVAIELFNSEFDSLPDSGAKDQDGTLYCGAMKLAEAMVGQDLMGFHPDSVFMSNGMDLNGEKQLYYVEGTNQIADTSARKGPYLPIENANAYRLQDIYGETGTGPFEPGHFVLCDVFGRVTHRGTGKRIGMPILYYKANTANTMHDDANPENPDNIYDYHDNQDLLMLGKPWDPPIDGGVPHKLAREEGRPAGERFYMNTLNEQVTTRPRPYRADTYILISAGNDGEYGTADDICNFDWKYRELQ